MKNTLKNYLSFSRKERVAVIVLLVLMSAFIAAPYLYEPAADMPVVNDDLSSFLAGVASDRTDSHHSPGTAPAEPAKKTAVELFPFDPNTIAEKEWLRLGLGARLTRTLMNYRSRGGKFRSPEDIRKIWGLSKADADRLVPYVRIARSEQAAGNKTEGIRVPPKTIGPIDINTATVEEWKALPGIGDVLSARIVKFRDRSAGFISIDHVRKTYGISDSLFASISPYLRFNPDNMPKLDLNTASVYELRTKTGISYSMAKAIVDFRVQNGMYGSVADIRKAVLVPDSLLQKMVLLIKTE